MDVMDQSQCTALHEGPIYQFFSPQSARGGEGVAADPLLAQAASVIPTALQLRKG